MDKRDQVVVGLVHGFPALRVGFFETRTRRIVLGRPFVWNYRTDTWGVLGGKVG